MPTFHQRELNATFYHYISTVCSVTRCNFVNKVYYSSDLIMPMEKRLLFVVPLYKKIFTRKEDLKSNGSCVDKEVDT